MTGRRVAQRHDTRADRIAAILAPFLFAGLLAYVASRGWRL